MPCHFDADVPDLMHCPNSEFTLQSLWATRLLDIQSEDLWKGIPLISTGNH